MGPPKMELALIYNPNQRVGLGERCFNVLKEYKGLEISQFDLNGVQSIKGGFDLYLRIDDGDYTLDIPHNLKPSAWWVADTHLPKPYKKIRKKIKNYDFIFCCQKEGAERLYGETGKYIIWIPWATDEVRVSFTFPQEKDKIWDICFIGTEGKHSLRKVVLEILRINYKNIFIGRAHFTELRDYYSKSKIVVNYPINNDINPRIFEAMSGGALVITYWIRDNGFSEIFKVGENIVVFDDILKEMKEKIDYYLQNREERKEIALKGFELVNRYHTYRHRLREIFRIMGFNLENLR